MIDATPTTSDTSDGLPRNAHELLPLVYAELRRLAQSSLANEKPGQTLQATALVHEAYLRLLGGNATQFESRKHFFNAAAEAMRRILVDNSRRKKAVRHGGGALLQPDDALASIVPPGAMGQPVEEILDVHEALDKLAAEEPYSAEIVKLHYFAGLTLGEIAELHGVAPRTTERHWAFARAWLSRNLSSYSGAKQN